MKFPFWRIASDLNPERLADLRPETGLSNANAPTVGPSTLGGPQGQDALRYKGLH